MVWAPMILAPRPRLIITRVAARIVIEDSIEICGKGGYLSL
jgi:hypothetical protein